MKNMNKENLYFILFLWWSQCPSATCQCSVSSLVTGLPLFLFLFYFLYYFLNVLLTLLQMSPISSCPIPTSTQSLTHPLATTLVCAHWLCLYVLWIISSPSFTGTPPIPITLSVNLFHISMPSWSLKQYKTNK